MRWCFYLLFQLADNLLRAHPGQCLDVLGRVKAGAGNMYRTAKDEQVWHLMAAAVFIHHRALRVITHPGASLGMG